MISIEALTPERLADFFRYLSLHIAENGQPGAQLFVPLAPQQSALSPELKSRFEAGMGKAYGEAGWRRAWVALHGEGRIMGHIDLRANGQLNAEHRVLLGMGVDRDFRRQNVGQALLAFICEYGRNHPRISWIDLEVLDSNQPAKRLYEKMGFTTLGLTKDMFRIAGVSYDYASMTLQVGS